MINWAHLWRRILFSAMFTLIFFVPLFWFSWVYYIGLIAGLFFSLVFACLCIVVEVERRAGIDPFKVWKGRRG